MQIVRVSGALWWKLCEGISTMTLARAHAKCLVFSCILMKVLSDCFASQGLYKPLLAHAAGWICRHHPLVRIRMTQELLGMRRIWPTHLDAVVSPETPSIHVQFSLVHLETDLLGASPHSQWWPSNWHCCYREADNGGADNFVRPEHHIQMSCLWMNKKRKRMKADESVVKPTNTCWRDCFCAFLSVSLSTNGFILLRRAIYLR